MIYFFFVLLVSRDYNVAPPHDVTGSSAVCDCGISRPYSVTIFLAMQCNITEKQSNQNDIAVMKHRKELLTHRQSELNKTSR